LAPLQSLCLCCPPHHCQSVLRRVCPSKCITARWQVYVCMYVCMYVDFLHIGRIRMDGHNPGFLCVKHFERVIAACRGSVSSMLLRWSARTGPPKYVKRRWQVLAHVDSINMASIITTIRVGRCAQGPTSLALVRIVWHDRRPTCFPTVTSGLRL
jgi:hypothetical protein